MIHLEKVNGKNVWDILKLDVYESRSIVGQEAAKVWTGTGQKVSSGGYCSSSLH